MSSFSIRDILDLPEDTIRTLQAIKNPMEMSTCTEQPTELSSTSRETNQPSEEEEMQPLNGKQFLRLPTVEKGAFFFSCFGVF